MRLLFSTHSHPTWRPPDEAYANLLPIEELDSVIVPDFVLQLKITEQAAVIRDFAVKMIVEQRNSGTVLPYIAMNLRDPSNSVLQFRYLMGFGPSQEPFAKPAIECLALSLYADYS
ncbi:MAG: hypothetical protein K0R28_4840 [Paenibacillus sp.]|nr:hypothetical protein [Paenibacillus sp.]